MSEQSPTPRGGDGKDGKEQLVEATLTDDAFDQLERSFQEVSFVP